MKDKSKDSNISLFEYNWQTKLYFVQSVGIEDTRLCSIIEVTIMEWK